MTRKIALPRPVRSVASVASVVLVSLSTACGGSGVAPTTARSALPPRVSPAPAPAIAAHADATLIPREVLFGNADHAGPELSLDGKYLAMYEPVNGVLNIVIAETSRPTEKRPLTTSTDRPIANFQWSKDANKLIYWKDAGGDENYHLYSLDIRSGKTVDLTPYAKVRAQLLRTSFDRPGEVLIGMNDRDPKYHDVYRVDLASGKRTLVLRNDADFSDFVVDRSLHLRLAGKTQADGSIVYYQRGKGGAFDDVYTTVPFEDARVTGFEGFDRDGRTLYMIDSRGRDAAALVAVDFASKKSTVLAEDARSDIFDAVPDMRTGKPLVIGWEYDHVHHKALDPAWQSDLDHLAKLFPDADVSFTSVSADGKMSVVATFVSDGPVRYYLYDRTQQKADFLFNHRDALAKVPLAKMKPVVVPTRDGLSMMSYLTLPKGADADGDGKPDHALPLVLYVHGGPWFRDSWGFNPTHQWLANRGYAVLSVNYRGSAGFGKKFMDAGNREWGGKMNDDLLDAVKWATTSGIADPAKIAIHGASYGGYATLAALTLSPNTYACGVDEVGPSNLLTFEQTIPPYWEAGRMDLYRRVGDPRTEEGKKRLLEQSPLTHVDAMTKPLLIGQGANDPRVNRAESEQFVAAMSARHIPVTYVLFPDEGHGFQRPENEMAFTAASEMFFAQCLGGSYEPIGGSFAGSTIEVPAGASEVYGLPSALADHSKVGGAGGTRWTK